MGIQSTIYIKKEEAARRYANKKCDEMYEDFRLAAQSMPDDVLEDAIEEYFYNYKIID